jgi:hypothetical protein
MEDITVGVGLKEMIKNAFETTGIYPINKQRVLDKLERPFREPATDLVSPMVIKHLQELRESAATKPDAVPRGRRMLVSPGKSLCPADLLNRPSTSGIVKKKKPTAKAKKKLFTGKDSSSSLPDVPVPVVCDDEPDLGSVPIEDVLVPVEPLTITSELAPELEESAPAPELEESAPAPDLEEAEKDLYVVSIGDFVLIECDLEKKSIFHYVGKIIGCIPPDLNVEYFRYNYELSTDELAAFKRPESGPDYYPTQLNNIARRLELKAIKKGQYFFKNIFKGMKIR